MAATDPPAKNLLTLIRGFASDKYQGERRVIDLKKRISDLRSEVDSAYEEVENAKRRKETIELEFKGYEVEFAIKEASALTLEAMFASFQDQVSAVRSDLQSLKNEEGMLRDEFIKQMMEMNDKIRRSLDIETTTAQSVIHGGASSEKAGDKTNDQDPEVDRLKEQISSILSQITIEEKACEEEQKRSIVLRQELSDARRKLKELQGSTRQASELETAYAELGEELQRRCVCPSCCQSSSGCSTEGLEGMEGISQNN